MYKLNTDTHTHSYNGVISLPFTVHYLQ